MIELESLAAFDCLQWLRTGDRAAGVLGCNQSTISRATRRCQDIFGVELRKVAAEWHLHGDDTLLKAERRVHQLHRWTAGSPLRLEAQHWLRHTYTTAPLPGWIKGNLNYLEYSRPLQLLRDRVIDAWLCSSPDTPEDPALQAVPLCEMPTWLIVRNRHPLLQAGDPLTLDRASRYPVLPLPEGAFPVFQARFAALGFHSDFSMLPALARKLNHDPSAAEDLALAIASPLTLSLYGDDWSVLPLEIPLQVGDVLMLRRELADHPRAQLLIHSLSQHLASLAVNQDALHVLAKAAAAS